MTFDIHRIEAVRDVDSTCDCCHGKFPIGTGYVWFDSRDLDVICPDCISLMAADEIGEAVQCLRP